MADYLNVTSGKLSSQAERSNWFSIGMMSSVWSMPYETRTNVKGDFRKLDIEHKNYLSAQNMNKYNNSGLTDTFIARLFEEYAEHNKFVLLFQLG